MATRAPRSIQHIDPQVSLHRQKRFQKKFMVEQCSELIAHLDDAIHATFKAAPRSRLQYLLSHATATQTPAHKEAQLERALHRQWSAADCDPAAGCWDRIVAFQVSLPASRDDTGWGEIDLLGVAHDGLPVVIELKKGRSTEPPVNLLVQAAAYGIVLQKAWWSFREEWIRKVRPTQLMPTALSPCHLACVAPEEYWQAWNDAPVRQAVQQLRYELARRGLEASMVSLAENDGRFEARIRDDF